MQARVIADIINGIGCRGKQIVTKDDLMEVDTQSYSRSPNFIRQIGRRAYKRKTKIRDMLRKAAFGVNFAIIGIENQEKTDYSMPLRNMIYDAGEYEKQAVSIRREIRKNSGVLNDGEYLYGFKKDSRLKPVITFIIYSGIDEWDGAESLHDILDFTDIPDELKEITPDYKINLIEIRKLKDTSMFKTDVRQVFDFIRCSGDKDELRELVKKDDYYKNMEEDAFDLVVNYTNATQLIEARAYYREDGKVNMCQAITELIEEGRIEVMTSTALRMIAVGKYTIDEISNISGLSIDEVNRLNEKGSRMTH